MGDRPDKPNQQGLRIALFGLLINGALAIGKLVAGVAGHSFALVADAVESLADLFGSMVVWGGIRYAQRPPDRNHPYGHGKAEPLAALIVSFMLIGAAIGIGIQSIRGIIEPGPVPAAYTLWVLIGVVIVKETMAQIAKRSAKRSGSSATMADSGHHRSDAVTSLAAAIGIGVALIGGEAYAAADDWAALVASGVIFFNGVRLMIPPIGELTDLEPVHVTGAAQEHAESVEGVQRVEQVQARKSGTQYWVDMHIEVDPGMSVAAAHELAHEAKDAIREAMPEVADVLMHIEPGEEDAKKPDGDEAPPEDRASDEANRQ